jgi:hypothetical protein
MRLAPSRVSQLVDVVQALMLSSGKPLLAARDDLLVQDLMPGFLQTLNAAVLPPG